MYRPEMGTRLPNTLMLEAFLRRSATLSEADAKRVKNDTERDELREKLITRVTAHVEEFADKFRDGQDYRLFGQNQIADKEVRNALAGMELTMPDGTPFAPIYVSREKLLTDAYENPLMRRRMTDLCDLASRRSLLHSLDERHLAHLKKVEGITFEGRDLANLVGLSLGSQRLLEALDVGFGYSFAHIFKDDIVAVWICYVGHALVGDTAALERMEPFLAMMRRTFPVACLMNGEANPLTGEPVAQASWIFMVS